MKTDWTTITRGIGDAGQTSGVFCEHSKGSLTIRFLALFEKAQVKLGIACQTCSLHQLDRRFLAELEGSFRNIMGTVSAWKSLPLYKEKLPDAVLKPERLLNLDSKLLEIGLELNRREVPMDWINYTPMGLNALSMADFTTELRHAESVFFELLEKEAHEVADQFKLEGQFLNRLSKMSHAAMVLQDHIDETK